MNVGALSGRVALVTGGGRGIGAASARELAGAGADLVLAARTIDELADSAEACRSVGARVLAVPTDVADSNQVRDLFERAIQTFERVDVVVNAAGVYGPIGPISSIDLGAWARAVDVNLLGTLHVCQLAVQAMIPRGGGRIVTFSGGGATAPLPRFSAYGVSKAAVVRLTETLAEEVRQYGIAVNAIAPGAVDTRLQDDVLSAGDSAGPLYNRIAALRDSGVGGTPIEVPASLVLYLCSEAPIGLTGRLIAAPYDPWREWTPDRIAALEGTPWYTLRRIDPHTIGPLAGRAP